MKKLTIGSPEQNLLAIDAKGKTPSQVLNRTDQTGTEELFTVIREEFDVKLEPAAIKKMKVAKSQGETVPTVSDIPTSTDALTETDAIKSQVASISDTAVKADIAKTKSEAEKAISSELGQQLKTTSEEVADDAVKIYVDDLADTQYTKLTDTKGTTTVETAPTTDPKKVKAFYKAMGKLVGDKDLQDLEDPKSRESITRALLKVSVTDGIVGATAKLLGLSNNQEEAKSVILDAAVGVVTGGNLASISNVIKTVGASALSAKVPNLKNDILKSYKPDPTKSKEVAATELVGTLDSVGMDWKDTKQYTGLNAQAKDAIIHPSVEGHEERSVQVAIVETYT